ncbi:MAG: UbiA family prenyltransferase [Myxococcales bacterium]|nr:UbiA family prenyltransferase [Myxococcales bacterium]
MTQPSALRDGLAIIRYHIVLIAMAATVVFGWLMTGRYAWALALVTGLDWFLINLLNRVTDIAEDRRNQIAGTERVAARARLLTAASFGLMATSFAVTHWLAPALTPYRLAVQLIGLGYNYKIVPTPRGLSRFKELYFFKNFGSAVIFFLTGFMYPLALARPSLSWAAIASLVLFFLPFEITYEILYDLRDLEGDRAEGVPTYPVVHGPLRARQIIDALLVLASLSLAAGLATGALGLREGLMLAAPVIQFVFYRRHLARGLTPRDCIALTHLGTALLLFYLAGTAAWSRAGLPENIFLR